MSSRSRAALGDPRHLVDLLVVLGRRTPVPERQVSISALRLWRIWQGRDFVLLGAQLHDRIPDISFGLRRLQRRMQGHFWRLLAAERFLALRARRTRRGGGRRAMRQIELERKRLGRELHTGAGQMLAAVQLQLEVIAAGLASPTEAVQQALDRISVLTKDTLEQVRTISKKLHPPEWQRLTLEAAIRQLWDLSGIPQRFEAVLQIDSLSREPDLEVKVLLYRTVQEALSNLVRHSHAKRVSLSLTAANDVLTLEIVDDGVGFDATRHAAGPAEVGGGIGLRSIREQADLLGGKMWLESSSSGTKVVVSVGFSPVES